MIEALDPKRLFIFHINDAEALPLERLTDAHRLLPGLGILPLKEIIAAFKKSGSMRTPAWRSFVRNTGSAIRLSWREKRKRRWDEYWLNPQITQITQTEEERNRLRVNVGTTQIASVKSFLN
jgi:hypothetical protein